MSNFYPLRLAGDAYFIIQVRSERCGEQMVVYASKMIFRLLCRTKSPDYGGIIEEKDQDPVYWVLQPNDEQPLHEVWSYVA
jgi:hypothetical protein